MMGHRAAPGPRLSTGRIRVDAARAIAKLREYQLVDGRTWVLEAIRAAVASGARAIRLDGDANDVWLAWDGEPWPAAVLPTLFDELVSPEPARESQHLRLLATAVNSALGMGPVRAPFVNHVDVIACAGATATRVRYTPEVLVPIEDDDAAEDTALRQLETRAIEPPARAPTSGMLIHVRRRIGLDVLTNLVRGEPPELAIARTACMDSAVPITIDGVSIGRDHHARDLVHVPLGNGLDGFVAVLDPTAPRPDANEALLEIAERGVVLATYPLPLFADAKLRAVSRVGLAARTPVPIRVFVDAARMPTNASRSEVRRDAHPIAAAVARASVVLPDLIDRLVAALGEPPGEPLAEPLPPARRALLRTAAIDLVASQIAGGDWSREVGAIPPPIDRIAALPLLRNATGTERAIDATWSRGVTHAGDTPCSAELAPWLGDVLWLAPGDAAARLLGQTPIDPGSGRRRARRARKGLRRHTRFMRHAARPPVVAARTTPRVRLELGAVVPGSCMPAGLFHGVTGELCVLAGGGGTGQLVILHLGRELDTIELPSTIPFQAVVACDALRPDDKYRAVIRDQVYDRALRAVWAAVVRAAEAIAVVRKGGAWPARTTGELAAPAGLAGEAAVLRRAIGIVDEIGVEPGLASPLIEAAIWPTIDDRWVSVLELGNEHVAGTTLPGAHPPLPGGRMIVAVDALDRETLSERLVDLAHVVHYDPAVIPERLAPPETAYARQLNHSNDAVALAIREPGVTGAIALARAPWLRLHHAGIRVHSEPYQPRLFACEIVVDDDAIIPAPTWDDLVDDAGRRGRSYADWERALLRSIAAAILGDPEPDLERRNEALSLHGRAGGVLCTVLADHTDPDELLGPALAARLRAFRVIDVLGFDQPRTADELRALAGAAIPYVEVAPSRSVPGWHAIVAEASRARAFGKLAGRSVYEASETLAARLRAAARADKLATLRARSPVPLALPVGVSQVQLAASVATGVVGVGDHDRLVITVHVEGRPLGVTEVIADDLPLVAVVDVPEALLDDTLAMLRPDAQATVAAAVRAAVRPLLQSMIAHDPRALVEDPYVLRLLRRITATGGPADGLRAKLWSAPMFRTIHGGYASLADAAADRVVRIASWDGDWIGPGDGDPPHALDRPVIRIADDDAFLAVVEPLARDPARDSELPGVANTVDVTDAVRRLQTARRIARGLIVAPTVPGARRDLVRRVEELGPDAAAVGPGEIGLVDADESHVVPHADGRPGSPIRIDVWPPVQIAIEAPELVTDDLAAPSRVTELQQVAIARVTGDLVAPSRVAKFRQVAIALVRDVCRTSGSALPVWARWRLRNALIRNQLAATDVGTAPILETTGEHWLPWTAIADQRARFGTVWTTRTTSRDLPLDPERIALRIDPADLAAAPAELGLIDATEELRLDAITRVNQARPLETSIGLTELERGAGLHAGVSLTSGGRHGVVVPLAPRGAGLRAVRAHRALFRFDAVEDPCPWPTVTVVDDPALAPDRTWSRPAADAAWAGLIEQVIAASTAALKAMSPPPDGAVAQRWIEPLRPTTDPPRTGWLWLVGPSVHPTWLLGPGEVRVTLADRELVMQPDARRPVWGWLAVATPSSPVVLASLDRLFAESYTLLVRRAAARIPRDDAAAHVALALLRGSVSADDVPDARFQCFRPLLGARELVKLFHDDHARLDLIAPDQLPVNRSIIDDGSALSRLMIQRLGGRAMRSAPGRRPVPAAAEAPGPVAAVPPPESPAPAPAVHLLQGLADAVWTRLHAIGIATGHVTSVEIDRGRTAPLVSYTDGVIALAADPHHLAAIEAARQAHSPWADAAIDALVAHAVAVLDVELTAVTEATQAAAIARLLGA